MSEKGQSKQSRIYMDTMRSTINPAIAASVFKAYDAKGTATYHYEIDRAWKSKGGRTGYSKKYYTGQAEAISEVAELADMAIKVATKGGFAVGRKLAEKLSEKLTTTQQQAITVEKFRVLEEEYTHIKERGEDSFWRQVVDAVAEVE